MKKNPVVKIGVRACILEILMSLSLGYYIGRYYEAKKQEEKNG